DACDVLVRMASFLHLGANADQAHTDVVFAVRGSRVALVVCRCRLITRLAEASASVRAAGPFFFVTPLPYVSLHVIQPQLVGLLGTDRLRSKKLKILYYFSTDPGSADICVLRGNIIRPLAKVKIGRAIFLGRGRLPAGIFKLGLSGQPVVPTFVLLLLVEFH